MLLRIPDRHDDSDNLLQTPGRHGEDCDTPLFIYFRQEEDGNMLLHIVYVRDRAWFGRLY